MQVTKARRLAAAVATFTAAVAVIGVSPASAGNAAGASLVSGCSWEANAELFSSVQGWATSGTARGRTELIRRGIADSTEISGGKPSVSAAFTTTIPVYFHVITDGRLGAVSDRQIADQINVLNLSYAGFYGGDDTGFRFTLAGVDRTDNAAWFELATFADEVAMKTALKQGGSTDLNIYTGLAAGNLGFAYYPSIVTSNQYEVLDGVAIHYESVPGGKIKNFNLGFTATHEVGHWLGLAHTFEQGCTGHGDYVDDTPAMSVPTSGCPEGKDTCSKEPGLDPIHNYMDYSYDSCYNQFTPGQSTRTQEQYLHWRVDHG
jgi:hypothetical protein